MHRIAIVLVFLAACAPAHAEIYECMDENGNKRFTNIAAEAKGCKVLNVGPIAPPSAAPAAAAPAAKAKTAPRVATPSSFPRVDRALQRERDNDRRRILEHELSNEEKLLAQARKELAEQESVRLGSERNYQRVLDRLEPYQEKVRRHESNVASLRREISKIR
jgi:hypothetical protein